jgi:hypothetical protein
LFVASKRRHSIKKTFSLSLSLFPLSCLSDSTAQVPVNAAAAAAASSLALLGGGKAANAAKNEKHEDSTPAGNVVFPQVFMILSCQNTLVLRSYYRLFKVRLFKRVQASYVRALLSSLMIAIQYQCHITPPRILQQVPLLLLWNRRLGAGRILSGGTFRFCLPTAAGMPKSPTMIWIPTSSNSSKF